MGGAVKKATKRYNKQHGKTGGVTKGAKGGKPMQQKGSKPRTGFHKKGSSSKGGSKTGGSKVNEEDEAPPAKPSVKDMDVDAFLDGGFEDIAAPDQSSEEEEESSADEGPDEEDGEEMGEDESDEDVEGAEDAEAGGVATGGNEEVEEEDSEEEDGGKGNDPVAADNKRLKGEVARHKAQLEALRDKDPEFYAYLQQTDANLLGFGEDVEDEDGEEGDEEGSGEEESGDEDEAPKEKVKEAKPSEEETDQDDAEEEGKPSAPLTVTSQLVNKWCAAAKADAPLGTMKQLVRAYRMACHYGDTEEEVEAGMKIASGAVYNTVLMFMLREADGIFKRMLGLDKIELGKAKGKARELTAEDVAGVTSTTKWRKVGPLIKSYLGNTLHALAAMTDAPLMAFTLRRIRASAALMTPQPLRKFADKLLKASLTIFGSSEEATPRLQAFLAIRALCLVMPPPFMEKCLRGVYRSYLANSKFVSASSAPHIAFMQTCAIELWGLDLQMSYAHAFSAIRQLAVSLRGALNMKTKDGYKEVYSWQGVNALELWARVLGAHADKAELRPLVYPLTQLLLGAARLVPTPRFFPLRLRLIRATHRLAVSTGRYVPLSAPLLEMLNWAELHKPPKAGAGSPQDLSLMLRAGKSSLRTSMFQEEVVTQVCELLAEHLAHWSCSPAFPELSLLPVLNLRRFAKTTKVDKFRKAVKGLMDAIEKNKVWVGNARDGADFAPKDITKAASFLQQESAEGKSPLQQYAKMLAGRAVQRAAARSTDAVDFTTSKGKKRAAESEDDEGGESQDQQRVGDNTSDDDREDDDLTGSEGEGASDGDGEDDKESKAAVAHKAKKAKKAGEPLSAEMLAALGGFGEGDQDEVLGQYQLSDEEEEGGSSSRTKQKQGKGVLGPKAPALQKAGMVNGIKGSKGNADSEEESSSGGSEDKQGIGSESGDESEEEGNQNGMEGDSGDGEEEEDDEDSAEIMGEDSDEDEAGGDGATGMKGGWGSDSEEGESDDEEAGKSGDGGGGKAQGSRGRGGDSRGGRRGGRGDRGGARGRGRFGGRGGHSDRQRSDKGAGGKFGGRGGRIPRGGGGRGGGRRGGFRGGRGRGR